MATPAPAPAATTVSAAPTAVCRYFHSSGGCARGNKCRFQHLAAPNRSKAGPKAANPRSTSARTVAEGSTQVMVEGVRVMNATSASRYTACNFFLTPEGCSRGTKCRFLHLAPRADSAAPPSGPGDFPSPSSGPGPTPTLRLSQSSFQAIMDAARAVPPAPVAQSQSKVKGGCQYYSKGFCARGDQCWFEHDLREAPDGYAAHVEELYNEARESDPEAERRPPCSICFETKETYALLSACDHIFCLDCLRNWRLPEASQTSSNNFKKKLCPMCRKASKFTIPASFYVKGDVKKHMIQTFRDTVKDKPCRYFAMGPYCPFGDDCFYAHIHDGERYTFDRGVREMRNANAGDMPLPHGPNRASHDPRAPLGRTNPPRAQVNLPLRNQWAGARMVGSAYNESAIVRGVFSAPGL